MKMVFTVVVRFADDVQVRTQDGCDVPEPLRDHVLRKCQDGVRE